MSNITINMAAKEYFERLRGKRTPKGTWVSGMYFFPCQKREHERCCKALELETEHNPLALWEHCKSIEQRLKQELKYYLEKENSSTGFFEINNKRQIDFKVFYFGRLRYHSSKLASQINIEYPL